MTEAYSAPNFRLLTPEDAGRLAELLTAQDPEYMKEFVPFAFEAGTIRSLLSESNSDRYWGIEFGERLVGLVMLRFHEKYERPSFGLTVAEAYSRRGFGAAALDFALAWCRDNGVRAVMLKVASDNTRARRLYESRGFVIEGTCVDTGHLIHSLRL
jgi:RimJ/RimL family protein N-acetyltransferase